MISLPPRVPRKITETDVTHACIVACNREKGVRCARNNVGQLKDERGIPVVYGLGTGSADVVGVITFGGVNSALEAFRFLTPTAFAFAIEIKKPKELGGRGATRPQRAWHAVARRRGMLVEVARTPDEAVFFVRGWVVEIGRRLVRLLP